MSADEYRGAESTADESGSGDESASGKKGSGDNEQVAQVTIRVVNQNGDVVKFRTKRTAPIRRLLDAYCERKNLRKKEMRFRYDGQSIAENATPDSLNMDDDEVIEVFVEQTGGGGF